MMGGEPRVSVIMATWGRGRHILPSVRSVLRQDMRDFELLIVGDGCADETGAVAAATGDPRVRWLNLERRLGSQSGPNNAGIAAARAGLIAYLGHDDIWEADHLSRLCALFRSDDPPDLAVSGAIFHLPNGLPAHQVTGLFGDGEDVGRFFFPPSSLAHRKDVIDRIGPWRMPLEIRAPVDEDLLLRATGAGMRFRSTGVVTVHKFAAGHRYLSYVEPASDEQEAMLEAMAAPDHKARIAAIVADVRARGAFMTGWDRNFDRFAPGEFARTSRQAKGLTAPEPVPLRGPVTIRHVVENAVLDWEPNPKRGFRVALANPRPRLLIPLTGRRARLRFWAVHASRHALSPLPIRCNGTVTPARRGLAIWRRGGWIARYTAEITLRQDRASLIELELSPAHLPAGGHGGIAIGALHLVPL